MKSMSRNKMIAGAMVFSTVAVAALIGLFVWYAKTVIPHTYPTVYTNFFWGFVHGLFIIPTLVWSLFAHSVTIYQGPNSGNWYNLGYFVGISIMLGSSHGARKTKTTKK